MTVKEMIAAFQKIAADGGENYPIQTCFNGEIYELKEIYIDNTPCLWGEEPVVLIY